MINREAERLRPTLRALVHNRGFRFLPMRKVYFDTNVYTHIRKRDYGITTGDVVRLKSQVEKSKLRIYVSSVLLQETTSAILTAPFEALERLRLIYRIGRPNQVLTKYQNIIEGVIKQHATGSPLPSFLEPPPLRLKSILRNQSSTTITTLREIAKETEAETQNQKEANQEHYEKIWPSAKEEKEQGKQQTFEDYWNARSLYVAKRFADLAGYSMECKDKGFEGLLDLTVIKTMAVGMLSQGYSNFYYKTSIPRGDFNDLQHAVYGAAIGTLVTHDNKFAGHLKKLPIDGFEVIDIHALVSSL